MLRMLSVALRWFIEDVSNQGNLAARAYVGMSAAYECMDDEAEYEGHRGVSYVNSFYIFTNFR